MTDTPSSPSNVAANRIVTHVLYLSGAPRLSTKPTTESLGPRSHILGVIGALRESGSIVHAFVVGDDVPQSFHASGSEARMTASAVRLVAADLGRLVYRVRSVAKVRRMLRKIAPPPAMAYERYALMQELGRAAQRKGATWVLEVNALLAIESTSDRRATSSRRIASWFEKRTFRRADLIVAVTEQLKLAIHDIYGIPLDRIVVVENGVDTARHDDASVERQAVPTIGFLGTLYPWQRVDRLLRAVSRSETDWNVRIAGEGPDFDALRRLSDELNLGTKVTFLGRVHPDQVPAFLKTVDVCYAGHGSAEGVYFSPLKLWEYLAAGRPVLASRHDATVRLASEGYAVEVFDESDSDLERALLTVSSKLQELLETGVRDQERVRSSHSWTARIRPLLNRVAEGKPTLT